eukprot:TRINITY_DN1934_c0_g1_i13.p1 TRINITY_DN1934_c0_g1~~TRINITY_DN1934_c0_g1_i13.p1  ORF type:complete len:202 (+),score=26.29 TRINITY_DN1934_c0_g1_i13:1155-1760(+)
MYGHILQQLGPYRYMEGVVGTFHTMEDSLPADAYAQSVGILGGQGTGVFSRPRLGWIGKRYQEPVVAMQDDDIELPSEVEYAYYAVYNFFLLANDVASKGSARFNWESPEHIRRVWTIVNQGLSAWTHPLELAQQEREDKGTTTTATATTITATITRGRGGGGAVLALSRFLECRGRGLVFEVYLVYLSKVVTTSQFLIGL